MKNGIKAVVLAAGKGTRLRTEGVDLPKVLRQAAGRPLLGYVLEELSFLEKEDVVLVVGYEREKVLSAYPEYPHAVQEPQQGTGHAVQCAREALAGFDGSVLVCYGDMPLMRRATYESLIETHKREGNDCTLLSAVSDEELPYGRIVRKSDGSFSHIVEDKDCTPEEKAIREKAFAGYQINRELMAETNPGCMVQHCLPAHRGEEITADVFEEHAEEIFDEAENRLHAQKAVMYLLMGGEE